MNNPMIMRKRPNSFLAILVLLFFSTQLIIFPEQAKAELPCWNDGIIAYAEGKAKPEIPPCKPGQPPAGEPVNLATGNFSYEYQDLFIPGRGLSIDFTRIYNNQDSYDGPLGYGWNHNYNITLVETSNGGDNYVIRRSNSDHLDRFKKNPDGSYTSPPGVSDILTKEGPNFIITEKNGTKYTFDSAGRLLNIKDRNGNQIILNYDPIKGFLTSIVDTCNRKITLNYNTNNKLASLTDFTGRKITYDYDANGNLKSVTTPVTSDYPRGLTTIYSYDENHNLTRITDPKGRIYLVNHYNDDDKVDWQKYGYDTFYFSYDTANNTTTLIDRKGYQREWKFNKDGLPITKKGYTQNLRTGDPLYYKTGYIYNENLELTDLLYPRGNWVQYSYDDRGNILEIRRIKPGDPLNDIVTSFTYEPNFNQVKTITDPKGNVTSYSYDVKGNLIKITYPTIGGVTPETSFTYNIYGQVETTTDPNGNITKYEYYLDTGYLKRIIRAFGTPYESQTQFTYDVVGNVKAITDPRGNTTIFTHNQLNQLVQTISPAPFNYITNYFYNRNGNLERVSRETGDPSNPWQSTIYSYDILDQLKTIIDDQGNTTTFTYDANGNRISIQDAELNTTTYIYDERDLLFKVTDALGNTTEYSYDDNANLKEIKDANYNKTRYTYDDFDRRTTTVYPDSTAEYYSYDKVSNLIQKINRRNDTITYAYDQLNCLIQKTTPEDTISYTYDKGSKLKSVNDSNGTLLYTYDALNRVTSLTCPDLKQVSYEYNPAGNRTKLTYPDSTYITYEYDQLNRLAAIKDQASNTIASYSYDALSRRTNLLYLNGTSTSYTYDAINRLTELTNTYNPTPNTYSYTYDNVGNRLTKTDTTGTENYTYDNIYQVTNVTYPSTSAATYNYDALGNRTTAVDGTTTTYTTNSLNQYTSIGAVAYTYDGNANLISDSVNNYAYDSKNCLISATKTGMNATYTYDPFGRRIQKNVNGTITNFIYDGDQVICEYDSVGTLLRKFVYGPGIDEPILMDDGTDVYYYHFDGLGSVTALSDINGNLAESYTYEVYGKLTSAESALGNPYYFTGRRFDTETGLYHYRARAYNPALGRFLQTDPIGYYGGMNLYTYVENNPVNYIDPYGEYAIPLGVTITIGILVFGLYLVIQSAKRCPPPTRELTYLEWRLIGIVDSIKDAIKDAFNKAEKEEKKKAPREPEEKEEKGKEEKPEPDIRIDKPPSDPHYDKKTGKDEPEHWHERDYNWDPKEGKWKPGKWRYGGPGEPPPS